MARHFSELEPLREKSSLTAFSRRAQAAIGQLSPEDAIETSPGFRAQPSKERDKQ